MYLLKVQGQRGACKNTDEARRTRIASEHGNDRFADPLRSTALVAVFTWSFCGSLSALIPGYDSKRLTFRRRSLCPSPSSGSLDFLGITGMILLRLYLSSIP